MKFFDPMRRTLDEDTSDLKLEQFLFLVFLFREKEKGSETKLSSLILLGGLLMRMHWV